MAEFGTKTVYSSYHGVTLIEVADRYSNELLGVEIVGLTEINTAVGLTEINTTLINETLLPYETGGEYVRFRSHNIAKNYIVRYGLNDAVIRKATLGY